MAKKKNNLTLEEKLQNALVPEEEQPYQIPGNWVWTKLGNIAYLFTGNSISSKVKESKYFGKSEGLSYIATKDISFDHQIDYNNGVRIYDYQNFRIATSNTPLLCIEGGSSGKKIGFVLEDVCFGNKLCAFETQNLNSKLIYYYLQTDVFVNQFNNKRHGLIGGVSVKELNQISIPLPPLLEQQRIVECIESLFSKLDEAKEKIQMSLDSFETRKSAILYQAFSGELTKKWREENGLRLDDWEETVLKDTLQNMTSKKPSGDYFYYIDINSIDNHKQKVREPKMLETSKAPSRASRETLENDTLFSMVRPYLKNIAYIDRSLSGCIASTGFYVCRPNDKMYPKYLYLLLCSSDTINYTMKFMKGDNSPSIRKADLENMPVNLPSILEQKEIVRILDTIFEKEQDTQELIDLIEKIDLMKKSMLARAFRGELGTNLPEEESAMELLKSVLEV